MRASAICAFLAMIWVSSTAPVAEPTTTSAPWSNGVSVRTDCSSDVDGKLPELIPEGFNFSGKVRTYYVAAEQMTWNYAPSGWDNWLGVPIQDSTRAKSAGYTKSIGGAGGFEFQKALYRGYTNASFVEYSQQEPTAGVQGPTMRAEVGDLVQILFRNTLPDNYASIHSMGLTYSKSNEGSLYANTTNGSSPMFSGEEAVPPGSCVVYKWLVTNSSAPPPGEVSQAWSYHSYVNMRADLNAGLMGPFIVYARGQMERTMARFREFPILYYVFDEASSFLTAANAAQYGNSTLKSMAQNASETALVHSHQGNEIIWKPQLVNMPTVQLSSSDAPKFYTINGNVFAAGAPYEMCQYDPVIWYYYAFGSSSHAFHMHGNNFYIDGISRAVLSANDGEMFALYMTPEEPGVWQVICHVNNHQDDGMEQLYRVWPHDNCSVKPLEKD